MLYCKVRGEECFSHGIQYASVLQNFVRPVMVLGIIINGLHGLCICSILSTWEFSELQVVAKNYSTFGKSKTIGIAVLPFQSIIKDASLTLGLSPRLTLSDRGQAILNVLSVRTFDNYAKEFIALKDFHQRSNEGGDPESSLL